MPIAKLFRPVNTAKFVSIGASTVVGGEKGFATVLVERDNSNDHRAAAKVLQAEKAARPAAPCASYCYAAFIRVWQAVNRCLVECAPCGFGIVPAVGI